PGAPVRPPASSGGASGSGAEHLSPDSRVSAASRRAASSWPAGGPARTAGRGNQSGEPGDRGITPDGNLSRESRQVSGRYGPPCRGGGIVRIGAADRSALGGGVQQSGDGAKMSRAAGGGGERVPAGNSP